MFAQMDDLFIGDRDRDTLESYPDGSVVDGLYMDLVSFVSYRDVLGQGIGQVGVRLD